VSKLKNAIGNWVIQEGRRLAERHVIRNYGEFIITKPVGHALLSYLVMPLLPPAFFRDKVMFSNHGIAQEIPRALNELGLLVDVVDMSNKAWLPRRSYDLFIGHGGNNFEQISTKVHEKTYKLYFSTGLYWQEQNARLACRAQEFARRHNSVLDSFRAITNSEEYASQHADGIICLGNDLVVQTYAKAKLVIGINNAIFPLAWDKWKNKNYEHGRKHFLFFSGRGHLLKGLDLILEAFVNTDLHLHICQHVESDFLSKYEKEFIKLPNIHIHGFVKMRSRQFESLALKCDWAVSATCAEGQPGAMLECMAHGLVPIMPREANIDIDTEWCFLLEDCQVKTIRETVIRASKMPAADIGRRSEYLARMTPDYYSVTRFRKNFKKAVNEIMASRQPGRVL
jgi:glycosyltransferase involved in cell wall biosynthesis